MVYERKLIKADNDTSSQLIFSKISFQSSSSHFPIVINWVSPHSFLGVLGVIFIFLSLFLMKFLFANRIVPDGTQHSVASHLGLYCLPMCHKRDTRFIYEPQRDKMYLRTF